MAKIDMFFDGKARPKFDTSARYSVKNQLKVAANIRHDSDKEDDEEEDIEIETFEKIPRKKK